MKTDTGKIPYSIKEIYCIVYYGMRSVPHLSKARRKNELSHESIERIMLAVTEVNGCAICSYAHAKIALAGGMGQEEIQNMLSGVLDDVPSSEIPAILFAQHYADSRGNPSEETWNRIVDTYGVSKAYGILGVIRAIMIGNAYGIPWSSLMNRFKGKPDKRCSWFYEVEVITLGSLLMPFAMIQALAAAVFRLPLISFRCSD